MAVHTIIQCLRRTTLATVSSGCFCNSIFLSGLQNNISFKRNFYISAVVYTAKDNRSTPPSKVPSSRTKRWEAKKKMRDMYEYTIKPLPLPHTGGRGPNGHIWNHKRGGGNKRNFRMIDWIRGGPKEGPPLVEKVTKILYDPNRTASIALVAGGTRRRYIIATQHMQVGDLISSSQELTEMPVRAAEGDSYPVGSLASGTLINSLQKFPDSDGRIITSAGSVGQIIRKTEDTVTVRLPSKDEITVAPECVATVGRVSNVDHDTIKLGKAGKTRWEGIRPRSGLWHRKTGRFGRKVKTPQKYVYSQSPRGGRVEVSEYSYRNTSAI